MKTRASLGSLILVLCMPLFSSALESFHMDDKFTQAQFDSAFTHFKTGASQGYVGSDNFSRIFFIASSDPKYWNEFYQYYSENNIPETYETLTGERHSMACGLTYKMSLTSVEERKPLFEKAIRNLGLLGVDLNQNCRGGLPNPGTLASLYQTLENAMYTDVNGVKIYSVTEVSAHPSQKALTEEEMLIRAIDEKDRCKFFYQDEDKAMSDWSGSPSFLGLRACGKCNFKDPAKRMEILRAQQKKIIDDLKKSNSKLIAAMRPLDDLNKLDPACQWYIVLHNFTGEDTSRQKLKAPQTTPEKIHLNPPPAAK